MGSKITPQVSENKYCISQKRESRSCIDFQLIVGHYGFEIFSYPSRVNKTAGFSTETRNS